MVLKHSQYQKQQYKGTCVFHDFCSSVAGYFDVKIVTSEEEIVELARFGYECQLVRKNVKMINSTNDF
jgi:hypothetical protein